MMKGGEKNNYMELKRTINNLEKAAQRSENKGYLGDASEYSFQKHTLLLLGSTEKAIREQSEGVRKLKSALKANNVLLREVINKMEKENLNVIEPKEEIHIIPSSSNNTLCGLNASQVFGNSIGMTATCKKCRISAQTLIDKQSHSSV